MQLDVSKRAQAIASTLFRSLPDPAMVPQLGMRGVASILVFLGACKPIESPLEVARLADLYMERAAALLESSTVVTSLYGGLAGISLSAFPIDVWLGRDVSENYTDIQDTLLTVLLEENSGLQFDLVGGVVGLAAYSHVARVLPRSNEILNAALKWLANRAIRGQDGCRWDTQVRFLPFEYRSLNRPVSNLGLAHGVPGVLAMLGALERDHLLPEQYRWMLVESCDWVLSNLRFRPDGRMAVGYIADDQADARVAWCYGAPGVAYSLALAGSVLKHEEAIAAAHALTNLPLDPSTFQASGLSEPTLCHGYAGVAHLLRRTAPFLNAAGHNTDIMLDTAGTLYLHALEALEMTIAIGERPVNRFNDCEWYEFLEGLTGATMALLSAATSETLAWESLLLTH